MAGGGNLFDPTAGNALSGKSRSGGETRDFGEKEAARIVREGTKALGVSSAKSVLAAPAKSDGSKIVVVGILRTKNTASYGWIATRLAMEHPGSVSRMLSASRADRNLVSEQIALSKVLFPNEKTTQQILSLLSRED